MWRFKKTIALDSFVVQRRVDGSRTSYDESNMLSKNNTVHCAKPVRQGQVYLPFDQKFNAWSPTRLGQADYVNGHTFNVWRLAP